MACPFKFKEVLKYCINHVNHILKALDSSKLIAIRDRIHGLKQKMIEQFRLSDERKAELMERLKAI